jgi:cytochrome c oxidase assembly factor CtaG
VSVPPLLACAIAAALYALGGVGRAGTGPRDRRWREASFYLGVAIVFVALEPPFDNWADTSFGLHMAQHVLLISVAAPLLVLGRPWPRMWMPFPVRARRGVARSLARGRWSAPLRLAARTATKPPVAVALLAATLAFWHIPSMYDAAARNEGIHVLEHTCFMAAALLFWGPLLEAPPIRARIDHLHRAGWIAAGAVPGWILAIVLASATHPLYPYYSTLGHRAFGLSAIGDQQIGAGMMWVPGSIANFVAFIVFVYFWLEPGAADAVLPEPRPEELSWT